MQQQGVQVENTSESEKYIGQQVDGSGFGYSQEVEGFMWLTEQVKVFIWLTEQVEGRIEEKL
jgi:hypothetical protein